jgi:hypothetical protein
LRDTQSRIITTKRGRRAEGFLQGNDMGQGGDSLATPLMYLAFPVIGVLANLPGEPHRLGRLGRSAADHSILHRPQARRGHEGGPESPGAVAVGSDGASVHGWDSKGGTEVAMQAGGMAVYAQMAKTYLWWAFGLVGILFVVCFVAAASHPHRGVIGGTAARFIQAMKWVGLIFATLVVAKVLPLAWARRHLTCWPACMRCNTPKATLSKTPPGFTCRTTTTTWPPRGR